MIKRKISFFIAVWLVVFYSVNAFSLTEVQKENTVKVKPKKENEPITYSIKSEKQLIKTKGEIEKNKCSNCSGNCSSCNTSDSASLKGWVSLHELPQLDSLTVINK